MKTPQRRKSHGSSNRSADRDLSQAWSDFLESRTREELDLLAKANIDLSDPESENLPMFHRLFEHSENDDGNSYFESIQPKETPKRETPQEPVLDFAVAIAARVIHAFDCPRSPEVNLHADCVRLAMGIHSVGSQKEVAQRHGRSKQFVHWKVKSIQRKLGIGKSCFNRVFR